MAISVGAIDAYKVSLGDKLIFSKISVGNDVVYSAGNTVTYYVDTDTVYQEDVDADETALFPTTFTPVKEGWEFVGWRLDDAASAEVLDELIMVDDPITLYAVFRQAVTVTYFTGSTTAQYTTKDKYYNNGFITTPRFTIPIVAISNWYNRGWSTSTAANGAVDYTAINDTEFGVNTTLYMTYYQTITLSYNGNGNTSGTTAMQSGYRYYSCSGNYVNPVFTVSANGFVKTGYTFARWRLGSTAGTAYSPGNTVTLTASAVMYAEWTYVGAPFYIVNGFTCEYAMSWAHYDSRYGTYENKSWSVGSKYVGLSGNGNNDYWTSQSIPTNGNATFYLTGYNDSGWAGYTLQIYDGTTNALVGQQTDSTGEGAMSINISGHASIKIRFLFNLGSTAVQPPVMRLY